LVNYDLTALSWRNSDCDGDGVINGIEWEDQTGINQSCDFVITRVDSTLVSEAWLNGDCDGDGILNGEEGYADFDGDEIPAFLDLDSDSDGVLDEMDACMNTPLGEMVSPLNGCSMVQIDADGDRVPDEVELITGTDPEDGCSFEVNDIDDQLENSDTWDSLDCDGDGINNEIEGIADTDGDGSINLDDTDADGDGILDSIEYYQDSTGFLDPCDFEILSISESVSNSWLDGDCDGDGLLNEEEQYADMDGDGIPNYQDMDSDGDGVTDSTEVFVDFTDHLSPCSFVLSSITVTPSAVWMSSDCDGDGISNGNELNNGTDPTDFCSFDVEMIGFASFAWSNNDCDGDGVSNGIEATDGTDPLDPCSLMPSSVHLTASEDWLLGDCDGDGIENQVDGLEDTDEDGTPNFLDVDTDMDGILDAEEGLRDINRDSIYDFLQPNTMPDSTDEVKVYSGISPNGDGMNDFLIIYGADRYPDNKLSIYNRWGNLIYEESGYGHNGVFFEGYATGSSTLLPDGVYFYVFEYRLETREVKMVQGFFMIHR
jgi:gliding motility-associated-like protein